MFSPGICWSGLGPGRRLPKAYRAAPRRLPQRAPAYDPAADALVAASLPAASGISRLPQVEGEIRQAPIQGLSNRLFSPRYRRSPDRGGQLHLLVAIDRTSKFTFVELHEKVTGRAAADFLGASHTNSSAKLGLQSHTDLKSSSSADRTVDLGCLGPVGRSETEDRAFHLWRRSFD